MIRCGKNTAKSREIDGPSPGQAVWIIEIAGEPLRGTFRQSYLAFSMHTNKQLDNPAVVAKVYVSDYL